MNSVPKKFKRKELEPSQHFHIPALNPDPVPKPTKDPKPEPKPAESNQGCEPAPMSVQKLDL